MRVGREGERESLSVGRGLGPPNFSGVPPVPTNDSAGNGAASNPPTSAGGPCLPGTVQVMGQALGVAPQFSRGVLVPRGPR